MPGSCVSVGILKVFACSVFGTLLWIYGFRVAVENWVNRMLYDLLELLTPREDGILSWRLVGVASVADGEWGGACGEAF